MVYPIQSLATHPYIFKVSSCFNRRLAAAMCDAVTKLQPREKVVAEGSPQMDGFVWFGIINPYFYGLLCLLIIQPCATGRCIPVVPGQTQYFHQLPSFSKAKRLNSTHFLLAISSSCYYVVYMYIEGLLNSSTP